MDAGGPLSDALFYLAVILPSFAVAVAAGYFATRLIRVRLQGLQMLDRPNERSSHLQPTPRGAGLALVPVILILWGAIASFRLDAVAGLPQTEWGIFLGAIGLLLLSWRDDVRSLHPGIRLAGHIVAVALGVSTLGDGALVFQGLMPPLADRVLAALLWVWFINLFNFMDGIDGITGVETTAVSLGLAILTFADGFGYGLDAVTLAGVMIGFLVLNWHPAKIFLGDSGSVPIGYLLGWLLIAAAARGLWAPALILPGYYLADATTTLLVRATNREKLWQAHRRHFYQIALRNGASHAQVARHIAFTDFALVAFAIVSIWLPWPALCGAGVAVLALLWQFARMGRARAA